MRKLRISTGPSRLSRRLARKSVKWDTLAARLLNYDVIDMTYDEYMACDREQQAALKDVGYFIGGTFKGKQRLLHEMATRCVVTLDIDHIDSYDLEMIVETYADYEFVVHSTAKYSEDTPRLRLVFPLAHDIPIDKYEPLARLLADQIGLDVFDDTTFQPARIMYWPSATQDGEIYKHHNEGEFIDCDAWLAECYDDWTDFALWPHSSRVGEVRPTDKRTEDPLSKSGIIGAFCRVYDIHAAIQRFELPYEPTDHDNRYRPLNATGPSGAVVYDDVFLYSHHESDIVGQQNVNAWDLVRLHKFIDADYGDLSDVSVMSWPSSKQMAALALSIPEVEKELKTPADEMSDVTETDDNAGGMEPGSTKHAAADLTFDTLRDEISEINPNALNLIEVCKSMIPRIAAARLDDTDNDLLAGALRDVYPKPKPGKASIVRDIKTKGKQLVGQIATDGALVDMEIQLIDAALKEHFDKGDTIKRVGRKCWTYDRGLWAIESDESVRGLVSNTFTRLRTERPEDMMQLVAAVGEGKTSALVKGVWQMLCDGLATKVDRDDPLMLQRSFSLPIINTLNCELHFDADGNMDVRDHDPENFYTTRISVEYDEDAKCPEWDRFMKMVFSNTIDPEDMIRHFEEIGGYVIQFSRWLKTWMLFHGEKDTGKSTAAMVLQEMLGNAYTGKPMAKLDNVNSEFAEAGLIGKLLMVDDDFAYDGHLPDGFLKTYSEEKPVTASIKFGDDVNFRARALPLILSNHWPVTRDTTGAFIERAVVVPFSYCIKGRHQDDQRRARMMTELPGILNRFVAGAGRLRSRGRWDLPMDCFDAAETWAIKSNPALQFIAECLDIGGGATKKIKRSRLYDVYVQWNSEQSGHGGRQYVMKKGQFFERMRAKLGVERKTDGEFQFVSVALKHDIRDEMEDIEKDW